MQTPIISQSIALKKEIKRLCFAHTASERQVGSLAEIDSTAFLL